jgi:hypothetical protein
MTEGNRGSWVFWLVLAGAGCFLLAMIALFVLVSVLVWRMTGRF